MFLDNHLHMLTHIEGKNFRCGTCGKSLRRRGHLTTHIFIHSGERNFKCDVCGKSLSKSYLRGNLNKHMLIHSREKISDVMLVESHFTSEETRDKHMLVHSGDKNFSCDVCGNDYAEKSFKHAPVSGHSKKI